MAVTPVDPAMNQSHTAFVNATNQLGSTLDTFVTSDEFTQLDEDSQNSLKTFREDLRILTQWEGTLVEGNALDDVEDGFSALYECLEVMAGRLNEVTSYTTMSSIISDWANVQSTTDKVIDDATLYEFPELQKILCTLINVFENVSEVVIDPDAKCSELRNVFRRKDLGETQTYAALYRRNIVDLVNYINQYKHTGNFYDTFLDKLQSLSDRKQILETLTNHAYPRISMISSMPTNTTVAKHVQQRDIVYNKMLKTIVSKPTYDDTMKDLGYNSMQTVASLKNTSEYLKNILLGVFDATAILNNIRDQYSSSDVLKYKNEEHKELSQTLKCCSLASSYRTTILKQIQEWFVTILRTLLEIQRHLTIGPYIKTFNDYESELSGYRSVISNTMLKDRENDPTAQHNHRTGTDGNQYYDVYTTIKETSHVPKNIVGSHDIAEWLLPAAQNIDSLLRWLVDHTDIMKIKNYRDFTNVNRSSLTEANISNNQYNLLSYGYDPNNIQSIVIVLWGRKESNYFPRRFDTYKDINATMHGYSITYDTSAEVNKTYFVLDDDEYVQATADDLSHWSSEDFYEKLETYSPIEACAIPSDCRSVIKSVLDAANLGIDYGGLGVDCVRLLAVLFANLLQVKAKICNEFKVAYETINVDCRDTVTKMVE